MGLLDDAIREHLELKRRRGAEPSEVARQEREALGPVRRLEGDDEPVAAAAVEPPAPAPPPDPEPLPAPPPGPAPVPEAATPPPPAPPPAPRPEEAGFEIPNRSAPPAAPSWEADDDLDTEVVEPDEEPDHDDVLEETPDFLQETPEHDRLWFEQKPPRPFDFEP